MERGLEQLRLRNLRSLERISKANRFESYGDRSEVRRHDDRDLDDRRLDLGDRWLDDRRDGRRRQGCYLDDLGGADQSLDHRSHRRSAVQRVDDQGYLQQHRLPCAEGVRRNVTEDMCKNLSSALAFFDSLNEYECDLCSDDCTEIRYQCWRFPDHALCCRCYDRGHFDQGLCAADFILLFKKTEASGDDVDDDTEQVFGEQQPRLPQPIKLPQFSMLPQEESLSQVTEPVLKHVESLISSSPIWDEYDEQDVELPPLIVTPREESVLVKEQQLLQSSEFHEAPEIRTTKSFKNPEFEVKQQLLRQPVKVLNSLPINSPVWDGCDEHDDDVAPPTRDLSSNLSFSVHEVRLVELGSIGKVAGFGTYSHGERQLAVEEQYVLDRGSLDNVLQNNLNIQWMKSELLSSVKMMEGNCSILNSVMHFSDENTWLGTYDLCLCEYLTGVFDLEGSWHVKATTEGLLTKIHGITIFDPGGWMLDIVVSERRRILVALELDFKSIDSSSLHVNEVFDLSRRSSLF